MTDLQETYEKYLAVCKVNKKEANNLIVMAIEKTLSIVDPKIKLEFNITFHFNEENTL